jgi:hypothetical protein
VRPWHLGNTTVRSPFRLRDGLVALYGSPLEGNLRGKEQDIAFRRLLGEHGIVELGDDRTYSVGRKWRSALSKLGFLYPEISKSLGIDQAQVGEVDRITPNGLRLIKAETVPAMQECFLRSLAAYVIPSALENDYDFAVFSPLQHILKIMLGLEHATGDSRINFIEMAVMVQLTNDEDVADEVIARILKLREQRLASANKRKFDRGEREQAAALHGYKEQTFNDYADTNFRYLKAAGLVQSAGRGIVLIPEKRVFVEEFIQQNHVPDSPTAYFATLCEGATLPTDNKDSALIVLDDLVKRLKERRIPFDLAGKSLDTPADIGIVRCKAEELLGESNEERYADQQAADWQEISAYMSIIAQRLRPVTLPNGNQIQVPQAEAPAYFEWVLWRAFLAIDSLMNKPYDARRFKVDQDFLPVGTAPGNGPDLVFEFSDFTLVVEVTLTQSSRQEAAEGESVRRHVATVMEKTTKPVYGLFIANKIDINTLDTFHRGDWFVNEARRIRLNIVPITLAQFREFFGAMFARDIVSVARVRALLDACCSLRDQHEAAQWRHEISGVLEEHMSRLAGQAA